MVGALWSNCHEAARLSLARLDGGHRRNRVTACTPQRSQSILQRCQARSLAWGTGSREHDTMSAAVHASAHAARITSGREACCSRSAAPAATSSRAAWAPRHRPRRATSTFVITPAAQDGPSSSGSARPSRQRRRLAAPPRAAAEAEAPEGALVPDRQGYRSFLMVRVV